MHVHPRAVGESIGLRLAVFVDTDASIDNTQGIQRVL